LIKIQTKEKFYFIFNKLKAVNESMKNKEHILLF